MGGENRQKGQAGENTGPDARRILNELQEAGMSFEDISAALEEIGMVDGEDVTRSASSLSSIANGDTENPPTSLVDALEQIDPSDFVDEEEENSRSESPTDSGSAKVKKKIRTNTGPQGYEARARKTVEFRAAGDGVIEGFTILFDTRYDVQGFTEIVHRGATTKTVKEGGIVALFNHSKDFPLARQDAGTLEIEERQRGVFTRIDLPDSPLGRNVEQMVRRGDVSGGSVGMRVPDGREEFETDENGNVVRHIHEMDIRDVGPVTFPANEQTTMTARSAGEGLLDLAEQRLDVQVYNLINSLINRDDLTEEQRRHAIDQLNRLQSSLKDGNNINGRQKKDLTEKEMDSKIWELEAI